jgi:hypothetical protein
VEQTEERAVGGGGESTEPYGILFRVKYDLEGGEAVDMGVLDNSIVGAVEQDMFLGVPVGAVWVFGSELGVVGVRAGAEGRVVRSLCEAVRIVGVKRMVGHPLEDGGGDETVRKFCCGLDGGRGVII